jgi:hypothetical protein
MRRPALAPVALCALAIAGCGGSTKEGPESNDKRGAALECLKNEKQLDAALQGKDAIQVGDPESGPRIRFFLTRGEAEAAQFQGTAEGTIQSGSALIYVRRNPDDLLEQIESCVDNL